METAFIPKKGTLRDQLAGVKTFFRTLQQERDWQRAEAQRMRELRNKAKKSVSIRPLKKDPRR